MNIDSLKTLVRSHWFATILIALGTLIVLLCIFELGVVIGFREATFSSRFGENYERNFGGTGFMGMPDGHGPAEHGVEGTVLSIASSTLIIENNHQPEQKVLLDSSTVVRNQENTVDASALTDGTYVVIVGDPNDQGEIEARLIRILPAPPDASSTAQ